MNCWHSCENKTPSAPAAEPAPPAAADEPAAAPRYQNLARTRTFQGGRFAAWSQSRLAVFGCGMLGARLVREAVLSGVGEVCVWDMDSTEPVNLGNQVGQVGLSKVANVTGDCERIRAGRVRGFATDVRHAAMRTLQQCDVLIDCTDDPQLVWSLTEISNGLARPLLRAAVDGSGELELGRVLCSHGGAGNACQVCTHSLDEVLRQRPRTACPGAGTADRAPTLAGGAIGSAVAGLALLQAQRLVTGHDLQRVVDREILLDLSHNQLIELRLARSEDCLSGHRRWELTSVDLPVDQATLADAFQVGGQCQGGEDLHLGVFLHPLHVRAFCACGECVAAVGTEWALPPRCSACGHRMQWLDAMQLESLSVQQAAEIGCLDHSLDQLGIPAGGILLAGRPGHRVIRLLLPAEAGETQHTG